MAARGARARKIVAKELNREEQKTLSKEFGISLNRAKVAGSPTAFSKPPPSALIRPSYSQSLSDRISVASDGDSVRWTPSETSSSKQSTLIDKLSSKISSPGTRDMKSSRVTASTIKRPSTATAVSSPSVLSGTTQVTTSTQAAAGVRSPDPGKKYVGPKGTKATVAPRGRMGGVPMKQSAAKDRKHSRPSHLFDTPPISPSPSFNQSSVKGSMKHEKTWKSTKLWVGHGEQPKSYKGLDKDEDLWMDDGDCLIFFIGETSEESPRPLLRLHTKVLERARSAVMMKLLKYGEVVSEKEGANGHRHATHGSNASAQWPLTPTSLENLNQNRMDSAVPYKTNGIHVPRSPETLSTSPRNFPWNTTDFDGQTLNGGTPGAKHPTHIRIPPSIIEEEQQSTSSGYKESKPKREVEITHEIWFRAPSHIKRPDVQRRHHMATRNFLALIYGLPIVGNDFYEMLSDLHNVMETYYEVNEPDERWNAAQLLIQYLSSREIDDVRNNLPAALGLLAWCEHPDVGWEAGYLEAFVHSVGMMSQSTMESKEYRNVSQVTRYKLQNAYNSMQLRIIEAEERLARFHFEDIWALDDIAPEHPARKSYDAFRLFLYDFYHREYGQWPTPTNHQDRWLNREVVQRLQVDVGSTYDYLVDRDIVWEPASEPNTRKWEMVNKQTKSIHFAADWPGLRLPSILIAFDMGQKYDHVPHPYPLLPRANTPITKSTEKKSSSIFRRKKAVAVPDQKTHFQIALAFDSATNMNRLGASFTGCKLLDDFSAFEKTTQLPGVSPQDARLGRWILIYVVLQVLSTISVDTGGLKYTEGCRYFLGPSLNGCPPWKEPDAPRVMADACQQRSYCWLAPRLWPDGIANGLVRRTSQSQQSQSLSQSQHSYPPYHASTIDDKFELNDMSSMSSDMLDPSVKWMESLLGHATSNPNAHARASTASQSSSAAAVNKRRPHLMAGHMPIRTRGPAHVSVSPTVLSQDPSVRDFAL